MRISVGDRVHLNDMYCSGRQDQLGPTVLGTRNMPNWHHHVECLGWYTVMEIRMLRSPIMHKTVPVLFCRDRAQDFICVIGKKRIECLDRIPRNLLSALDALRRMRNFQTVTEDELKRADEQLRYIFS